MLRMMMMMMLMIDVTPVDWQVMSGSRVAAECGDVAADMMGTHGRGELFYYRPINYDRYSRVHAQDFEPLMTQRNCLTPGRVSLRHILRFVLSAISLDCMRVIL